VTHIAPGTTTGGGHFSPEIKETKESEDSNYVRFTVSASEVFFDTWPGNCLTMTPWIQWRTIKSAWNLYPSSSWKPIRSGKQISRELFHCSSHKPSAVKEDSMKINRLMIGLLSMIVSLGFGAQFSPADSEEERSYASSS
jgi:hypothetical protein